VAFTLVTNGLTIKNGLAGGGQDQREMAEASALLDALLANCLDYIYFKDRQSRFVRYSRSLGEHFDLADPEGLKGKTDFDCYVEERARAAYEDEQRIIRTGEPLIGKLEKGTRADGRTTWVLTTKMPWRDAGGNIIGTFGISKDVTALKEAEAELAQTSSLLEMMLEHSPDCIYFKDRQSRFLRCSRALAQHVHASDPGSLEGKTDFDIFLEEHARAAFEDEQKIIQTGRPIISKPEKETHSDGRTTWALTTKLPWRDKDGNIVGTFGSSKDITAIKDAETKIEEMHRQLLETSRLAGMAEVATAVLHNVGNVLNSVNVSAALMTEQLRKSKVTQLAKATTLICEHAGDLGSFLTADPKGRKLPVFLSEVTKVLGAERDALLEEMAQLNGNINHIKDVVAMQESYARVSGVTDRVRVADLVEDGLRMNASVLAEHDVQVDRQYDSSLPTIIVDKHKALQILVNLIRNACHACEESGQKEKRVTVRIAGGNGVVRIEVVDNGIGIPQENLTRIFNHDFARRKDRQGFGLHSGALAAKEIGGLLIAHSGGPGAGATFTLQLPLQPSSNS